MSKEEAEKMLAEMDAATTTVVDAFLGIVNRASMRPLHVGLISKLCEVLLISTMPAEDAEDTLAVAKDALRDWFLLNRTTIAREGSTFVLLELSEKSVTPETLLLLEQQREKAVRRRAAAVEQETEL